MGCGPGPGKGGQKKAKTPPLAVVPQRTPNRKQKSFFFLFQTEDLLNPRMVWIAIYINRVASYSIPNLRQNFGGRGT